MLLAITAPVALAFGFGGASAARSHFAPLRWFGKTYIAMVRGVPDIAFFLFFVIALDQGIEYVRHKVKCPDWDMPIRQGNDFVVCAQAKMPLGNSPQWFHEAYGFTLAVLTFAIVFGAFAANVLFGAMRAVPKGQLETAEAYGMSRRQTFWRVLVPQMWVFALPGLSNLWMVLIKATPLLFLWASKISSIGRANLAAPKTPTFTDYPHGDWRIYYFAFLLVFYLCFTKVSEIVLDRIMARLTHRPSHLCGRSPAKGSAIMEECIQTIMDYGLRSQGIGERLLPRSDFTLCQQFTLIGSGMIWNIYFRSRGADCGFFFATALAMGKAARSAWLRKPAEWFIFMFRGSPLFIQFFFAYFLFLSLKCRSPCLLAAYIGMAGALVVSVPQHGRLFRRDFLWRAPVDPKGRHRGG